MSQDDQSTTPPASTATQSRDQRLHLPQVLAAKILTMILENGIAIATHQLRPHDTLALNALRRDLLLHCEFFNAAHQPEELGPRTRRSQVSFADIVVLTARLMRVLMKNGALTEAEERERVAVRNECFDQPFFDRGLVGSARPFVDDGEEGFVDEEVDV